MKRISEKTSKRVLKSLLKNALVILPVMLLSTNVYARSCSRQIRVIYPSVDISSYQVQTDFDLSKYIAEYIGGRARRTPRTQIVTITEAATEKTTAAVEKTTKAAERPTEKTTAAAEKTTKAAERPTRTTSRPVTAAETKTETTTRASVSGTKKSVENEILSLVNRERAANGLSALTLDTNLCAAAQAKAEDMSEKGYFSHTSPTYGSPFDMMRSFGISYKTAGENIAKGQKTPSAVMSAWMNSEGHRKNILSGGFSKLGVGYVNSGGTTYWVQMFIG